MKHILNLAITAVAALSILPACTQMEKKNDQAVNSALQNRNPSSDSSGCGETVTTNPADLVGKNVHFGILSNGITEKGITAKVTFTDEGTELTSVTIPFLKYTRIAGDLDLSGYPAKGKTDENGFFVLKDLASVNALVSWVRTNYCGKPAKMWVASRVHLSKERTDSRNEDSQLGSLIESYIQGSNAVSRTITNDGAVVSSPVTSIKIIYPTPHNQYAMCLSNGSLEISCQ